jgi:hypothetical protein
MVILRAFRDSRGQSFPSAWCVLPPRRVGGIVILLTLRVSEWDHSGADPQARENDGLKENPSANDE